MANGKCSADLLFAIRYSLFAIRYSLFATRELAKPHRSRDAAAPEFCLISHFRPALLLSEGWGRKWGRNADRRTPTIGRINRMRQRALCSLPPPVAGQGREGCARLSASHRGSCQGAFAPFAQLQARLPGTRPPAHDPEKWKPVFRTEIMRHEQPAICWAGVTRPCRSQSRESTSRAGRSTGERDARSCPGADRILPRAGTALAPLS